MTTYFNTRTGDRVEMPGRSARLDSLDVWQVVEGTETPTVADDGVLSRPTLTGKPPVKVDSPAEVMAQAGHDVPEVRDEDGDADDQAPTEPPAKNAPKAEWQAYARTRAQDSDEAAAVEGLTKEQLVEQYGGS
ncbi:hypothetical protein ACIGCZ_29120 [Streptomyces nigra]|uniref:hypothetical protein n=1 Tax=Streptomyces nigra TaxID=1827580 RepID=UPI0037D0AC83